MLSEVYFDMPSYSILIGKSCDELQEEYDIELVEIHSSNLKYILKRRTIQPYDNIHMKGEEKGLLELMTRSNTPKKNRTHR